MIIPDRDLIHQKDLRISYGFLRKLLVQIPFMDLLYRLPIRRKMSHYLFDGHILAQHKDTNRKPSGYFFVRIQKGQFLHYCPTALTSERPVCNRKHSFRFEDIQVPNGAFIIGVYAFCLVFTLRAYRGVAFIRLYGHKNDFFKLSTVLSTTFTRQN